MRLVPCRHHVATRACFGGAAACGRYATLPLPLPLAALAWVSVRPADAAAPVRYRCDLRERTSQGPLSLEFTVDVTSRDAFMVGNNGVSKVLAHFGEHGVTFLEPLPTGAMQTTTIAHAGAVLHSRHSLLPDGRFVPAQYEGFCAVR